MRRTWLPPVEAMKRRPSVQLRLVEAGIGAESETKSHLMSVVDCASSVALRGTDTEKSLSESNRSSATPIWASEKWLAGGMKPFELRAGKNAARTSSEMRANAADSCRGRPRQACAPLS